MLSENLSGYIFRGQADSSWPLATGIERLSMIRDPYLAQIKLTHLQNKEYWMLYEFKRRYHLYSNHSPPEDDHFEWLAIMQHHGAPTRLLDFTSSIFLALFFAIQSSTTDAAVWAVNGFSLRKKVRSRFELDYKLGHVLKDRINNLHKKLANQFLGRSSIKNPRLGVVPLEPARLTDRMARQQGSFLMPTDIDSPFVKNLLSVLNSAEEDTPTIRRLSKEERAQLLTKTTFFDGWPLIKIIIPRSAHNDLLRSLRRMNVSNEILFPGLDGLVRSLEQNALWG